MLVVVSHSRMSEVWTIEIEGSMLCESVLWFDDASVPRFQFLFYFKRGIVGARVLFLPDDRTSSWMYMWYWCEENLSGTCGRTGTSTSRFSILYLV